MAGDVMFFVDAYSKIATAHPVLANAKSQPDYHQLGSLFIIVHLKLKVPKVLQTASSQPLIS